MSTGRSSVLLVTAWATVACTPIAARVPLRGSQSAAESLIGEWRGEYKGVGVAGRQGSILFTLRSVGDTAQGAIYMEHKEAANAMMEYDARLSGHLQAPSTTALFIRFVAVEGSEVVGVLDPYRDPDCGCRLQTTFHGTLKGDVIEGTFESAGDGDHHLRQTGTWRVQRISRH
jgi:hypothetical protein